MAEERTAPPAKQAHQVFDKDDGDAPRAVRVNLADGTPKDIPLDDTEALEAHGIVACSNCGAPNHVFQLSAGEQPWVQCGCRGMRVEVALSKKGRAHLTAHREAMIAAVNGKRAVVGRG